MQLYSLVRCHFTLSFVLLLVGNFLVIWAMNEDKDTLKNRQAPFGIISLELTTSDTHQRVIIQSWAATPVKQTGLTALQVAQRQTRIDYLFILFYTLLLCLLLIRLAPAGRREAWIKAFVSIAITAGLLDCIENIFMQQAMNQQYVPLRQIFVPSAIKWLMVAGLSGAILYRCIVLLFVGLHKSKTGWKSISTQTFN